MSKPAVGALLHRQPQRLTAWLWRLMECLEGTAPAAWVARQSPQTANEPRADCLKIVKSDVLLCRSRSKLYIPTNNTCTPNTQMQSKCNIPILQLKEIHSNSNIFAVERCFLGVLKSKILKHKAPNSTWGARRTCIGLKVDMGSMVAAMARRLASSNLDKSYLGQMCYDVLWWFMMLYDVLWVFHGFFTI